MARRPSRRDLSTGILVILFAGVLVSQVLTASATHQPADKVAVAGSNIRDVDGADDNDVVILEETVRVSSTSDLVLSATSECSLVTDITTGDDEEDNTNTASARAAIDYYLEIDNEVVPVAQFDSDPNTAGNQPDDGRIIFCDRTYSQATEDEDDDGDVDQLDSHIATRTAHGFNWLAIDVGKEYDVVGTPAGTTNNIVTIELHAHFTEETMDQAMADAKVGRTTLVIEPTHASNHEQVTPGATTAPPPAP
jgi:hypothetical protein